MVFCLKGKPKTNLGNFEQNRVRKNIDSGKLKELKVKGISNLQIRHATLIKPLSLSFVCLPSKPCQPVLTAL